ncbi:MAG: amidohydrolase family protein [Candidatus Obscuribacterales bacterium]|nr:amidohydrolase family protein [Candidatus Obscuribacterales bacterium]
MKLIAIEEHYWYPPVGERSDVTPILRAAGHPAVSKLGDLGAGRISDMDAAGISMQVISHFDPGVQEMPVSEAVPLAREANDMLADAVKKYPDRFAGFATLPVQDPDSAVAELERMVGRHGFVGAMINGHAGGHYLDEQRYWPIFECAEKLGVVIYMHPTSPPQAVMDTYYKGYIEDGLHLASWGFGVEAATHALRLIYSGLFDKYPKLQMVLGHMGEMLPFAMWRIDRYYFPKSWFANSGKKGRIERLPGDYFRENFHISTSGNFNYPALQCSLMTIGADRILFSVDYPMDSNIDAANFINNAALSQSDREKIAFRNAEKLLGL